MGAADREMAGSLLLLLSVALLRAGSGVADDPGSMLAITEKKTMDDQVDAIKPAKEDAAKPLKVEDSYATIPGFVLKGPEKRVKDVVACQEACERTHTCSSFSFRQREPTVCMLVKQKLSYNPDWAIYVRGLKPDATGKLVDSDTFHGFPGILCPGFQRFSSISLEVCEEKCNGEAMCRSYNYKERDRSCQLSQWAITYDPEFVYYESKVRTPIDPAEDMLTQKEAKHALNAETLTAETNKKVRQKVEARERDVKETKAAFAKEQERVKQEADTKKHEATKERKEKKHHAEVLAEDTRDAQQRGAYAESVVKSRLSVSQAEQTRIKENGAKKGWNRKIITRESSSKRKETLDAKNEQKMKKLGSKHSHLDAKTKEERAYLNLREKAFEIHAKAVALVKEQRKVLGVVMPGDANRNSEEAHFLSLKKADKRKLRKLKSKLLSVKNQQAQQKASFDDQMKIKTAAFGAELEGIQKESKTKIAYAQQDATKLKSKEKATKLEAEGGGG